MGSQNLLVAAIAREGGLTLVAAVTTGLLEEARRRHQTRPAATAILGEAMNLAAILGTGMEPDEKSSVRIGGLGELTGVLADVDWDGDVRGFVAGDSLPGIDAVVEFARSLPDCVTLRGAAALAAEIDPADAVAAELETSGRPSCIAQRVALEGDGSVRWAGAVMAQVDAGADDLLRPFRAGFEEPFRRATILRPGSSAEDCVQALLRQPARRPRIDAASVLELRLRCSCSRERVASVLRRLEREELDKLRELSGGAEIACRFCGEWYRFDADELRAFASQAEPAPAE